MAKKLLNGKMRESTIANESMNNEQVQGRCDKQLDDVFHDSYKVGRRKSM